MNFTKIVKPDLDSPCRELSNGGLGIVVTLLACQKIDFFVFFSLIGNPAVCHHICRSAGITKEPGHVLYTDNWCTGIKLCKEFFAQYGWLDSCWDCHSY